MHSLRNILKNLFTGRFNKSNDNKNNFIYYKIVDLTSTPNYYYKIQCINKNSIFHAKIEEIVYGVDILHGLHPIQACYIGMEYAKYLKNHKISASDQIRNTEKLNKYSVCRYGKYELIFQDRKGNIGFINRESQLQAIGQPTDIAFSNIISEFDSTQSFYIGLLAGLEINKLTKEKSPSLKIITSLNIGHYLNIENKSLSHKSKLKNPNGYYVLIILSMIYMMLMLCNAILTNRYVGTDALFVLGGTLTSPFVFILDDIITEIYGYKIARNIILTGFASQTLFILICLLILASPHPSFFVTQSAYNKILGSSLLRIDLSGFVAYISANLINSYLISKWKILLKGQHFWLRSIGSSILSEALYSLIAIMMMELNTISLHTVLKIVVISLIIKITYTIVLAGPASSIVNYLKKITGIDVYDFEINLTPLKYSQEIYGGKN